MKKLTKDQLDFLYVIEGQVLDLADEDGHNEAFKAYMKVAKMLKSIRDEDFAISVKEFELLKGAK